MFICLRFGASVSMFSVRYKGLVSNVDSLSYRELPNKLWPKNLLDNTNFVELIDAKANVHLVKMDRYYEDDAWSFNGDKWVDFIKTVKDLGPKIIHLEQIDVKKFLVNFYTKDGDEVYYGFTKHHDEKCVVLGCTDPNMYQPIPHRMMLNRKVNRSGKSALKVRMFGASVSMFSVRYKGSVSNVDSVSYRV
ncbi:hypothetical protein Tco_0989506 [Tanacetum coccineum]|uniref:Uncharacterized protein n=1 Tax=Tanacetum coccineum TaxID=301880 RepID=A0ABQ5EU74_9ASTR